METNSESILVYPENFGEESRTLYLSGEANFKVLKNKDKIPFVVNAKDFAVTALGTEFNVCSYPNDESCSVTLIEGKVKVENAISGINETLNISEQLSYNRETTDHLIQTINLDEETAWQRGILMFKGFTIEEIIKVLERNYNVTFHYSTSKIDKDKYNFSFKKDITLENLLEVIKNVADNFEYKLNGDICYIYT